MFLVNMIDKLLERRLQMLLKMSVHGHFYALAEAPRPAPVKVESLVNA